MAIKRSVWKKGEMANLAVERIASYLPLSYMDIVWRSLHKSGGSILDVGCGREQPMENINKRKKSFAVGIDLYKPYIKECKRRSTHSDYVVADIRFFPFRKKSIDIVLCLQVIEHLSKGDGLKLVKNTEEIARKKVIISTPASFFRQDEYDDNPLQMHKSSWEPAEFRALGYKVRGQGLRLVYGEGGLAHHLPRHLKYLAFMASYLLGPLIYLVPSVAAHIICAKNLS